MGGAGRRRMRARQCLAPTLSFLALQGLRMRSPPSTIPAPAVSGEACLAPTLCPNVGATHWVALGRSCRRARSCSEQTNREAGLGNCGRRGAPPDEGEAVPRPYNVLFGVVGAPHAQPSVNDPRTGGFGRGMPRPYIVSQRRGDPLGRPWTFMPTRSFVLGTNKSRGGPGKLWAARGAAG